MLITRDLIRIIPCTGRRIIEKWKQFYQQIHCRSSNAWRTRAFYQMIMIMLLFVYMENLNFMLWWPPNLWGSYIFPNTCLNSIQLYFDMLHSVSSRRQFGAPHSYVRSCLFPFISWRCVCCVHRHCWIKLNRAAEVLKCHSSVQDCTKWLYRIRYESRTGKNIGRNSPAKIPFHQEKTLKNTEKLLEKVCWSLHSAVQ